MALTGIILGIIALALDALPPRRRLLGFLHYGRLPNSNNNSSRCNSHTYSNTLPPPPIPTPPPLPQLHLPPRIQTKPQKKIRHTLIH